MTASRIFGPRVITEIAGSITSSPAGRGAKDRATLFSRFFGAVSAKPSPAAPASPLSKDGVDMGKAGARRKLLPLLGSFIRRICSPASSYEGAAKSATVARPLATAGTPPFSGAMQPYREILDLAVLKTGGHAIPGLAGRSGNGAVYEWPSRKCGSMPDLSAGPTTDEDNSARKYRKPSSRHITFAIFNFSDRDKAARDAEVKKQDYNYFVKDYFS